MYKLTIFSLILIFSQKTFSSEIKFNHSGVQKGAIIKGCYRNPCSIGKVIKFKQLSKTSTSSQIELTMLGATQYLDDNWNPKKTIWNKKTHKVYVTCSIRYPTLTSEDDVHILPLNPDTPANGANFNNVNFYLTACHNDSDEEKIVKKFRYNVSEDQSN